MQPIPHRYRVPRKPLKTHSVYKMFADTKTKYLLRAVETILVPLWFTFCVCELSIYLCNL